MRYGAPRNPTDNRHRTGRRLERRENAWSGEPGKEPLLKRPTVDPFSGTARPSAAHFEPLLGLGSQRLEGLLDRLSGLLGRQAGKDDVGHFPTPQELLRWAARADRDLPSPTGDAAGKKVMVHDPVSPTCRFFGPVIYEAGGAATTSEADTAMEFPRFSEPARRFIANVDEQVVIDAVGPFSPWHRSCAASPRRRPVPAAGGAGRSAWAYGHRAASRIISP